VAENRITLVLEGMPRDGGHVRFETFLYELRSLQSALTKLDAAAAEGQRNSHFAVVGLSHSSPARVELEARTERGRPDVRPFIFNRFQQVYESIERNEIPADIDYGLLDDLRKLATPIGATLMAVAIQFNGSTFGLNEKIAKRIELHLSDYDECPGSVEGMLEKINVHDDANVFTVYPDVGPSSVTCHFPNELLDKAIAAVKKKVAVSGVMRYRKTAPFPHHVDVAGIDIFQDAEQLATFQDLFGIAPNATGELSSEEFVKELRCGWK